MAMVSGASEPTSISVVLKFSKLIKNATTTAPTIAGARKGSVIVRTAVSRSAPRFSAASSKVRSNFCNRAEITSVAMVVIKLNCPRITNSRPGRSA